MKNSLYLFLLFSTILLTPKIVFAQLSIGDFNSNGSPDWVEIKNNSDSEVAFSEYLITDVAGNKIEEETIIPPNGNCVFDYFNRLNNSGDTIFLHKNTEQIDCVKYGDGADGQCDNTSEPTNEKPSSNCYKPTSSPSPTATPTPVPSPTSSPTSTPKTVVASVVNQNEKKIIEDSPKIVKANSELTDEDNTPSPKVLAVDTKNSNLVTDTSLVGEKFDDQKKETNKSNYLIIFGVLLILASIAWIVFAEYNKKYFENSPFN